MKRNVKQPEMRKQELIAAACKIFIEKGYEKTSVRDILHEVGGEVGMFYHYFKSKDDIFEHAIVYFMEQHVSNCTVICQNHNESFLQGMEQLIAFQYESQKTYKETWSEKIHWSMLSAIYKKTMENIIPHVEKLVQQAVERKEIAIKAEEITVHEFTLFLVYGIGGVLHEKALAEMSLTELSHKQKTLRSLISQMVNVKG
jgi:AcrR family transcriptional regulator